jgi:phosphohistidine phosphatase
MKTLLILRHAKSSWKQPELSDHDRPLNKRGQRDAPRMGLLIADEGLTPDLILSSSAVRARRTAVAVAENCGYDGDVEVTRDFYHADVDTFLQVLRRLPERYESVMVVGHNPDLEELLEALIGDYERLTTAALAQVRLPVDRWGELDEEVEGQLVDLWRPRDL